MYYAEVIEFWFEEIDEKQWWKKDDAFDQTIRRRFGDVHSAAARCELYGWRNAPAGRLAEIIVLDQFSRNIYRGAAAAFAQDPMALCLSQELIASGGDRGLPPNQRMFAYMPYQHSESGRLHEEAVRIFTDLGVQENLEFELAHKAVIDRFGRYPHRNAILGRVSTTAELAFLEQPGSSF